MSKHFAKAIWKGNLPKGNGTYTLQSSGYEGSINFQSRFEDGKDSSPEELIGAALASCFSMALSHALDQDGATPESVKTEAEVTLAKTGDSFSITEIFLKTKGKVPGIEAEKFKNMAREAKDTCPVGRALQTVHIKLEAELL